VAHGSVADLYDRFLGRGGGKNHVSERVVVGVVDDLAKRLYALATRAADSHVARVRSSLLSARRPKVQATRPIFGSNREGDGYPGALDSAGGGTVILSGVEFLTLASQTELLRVISTHKVTRIGEAQEVPVDMRLVSTTSADLEGATCAATFRLDLMYRLSAITLRLPPLRERPEEIEAFARHIHSSVAGTQIAISPGRARPKAKRSRTQRSMAGAYSSRRPRSPRRPAPPVDGQTAPRHLLALTAV
jgi:DNA-binding NtrC family response regulator